MSQNDNQNPNPQEAKDLETQEWLDSLDFVLQNEGPERVQELLYTLTQHLNKSGMQIPFRATTPYINTIPVEKQPPYPGDKKLERQIRSLMRWNAMAMVVRANRTESGIGGHISTFASAATLYEVAFNHFFKGKEWQGGDQIYFQGHVAPGIYARAYLEGRLTEKDLENFRRELKDGGGLSSYPHPWLMPNFWEFPTVSMGLGPIMAIYQARFNRYLENRGLKPKSDTKVWAFLGDGETDEPESLGAISLAVREKLDNLIFVINCNLQRLDGPVRGNGKIIQELEANFRGAGWNVIKVIWGSDWDDLLTLDKDGLLVKRMGEVVDGQYQKYSVSSGEYIRNHFFGVDPKLLEIAKIKTDMQLRKLKRGGHDEDKVYAAYQAAMENKGSPTVILAHTIKGYGLGESGEGKNTTHQQKKMNEDELREFRTSFGIPISDEDVAKAPFFKVSDHHPMIEYIKERRKVLGGPVPNRQVTVKPLKTPPETLFEEFYKGTDGREVSTTMVFVRILSKLLRDKEIGKLIVPIVPDEARTFGMEALFKEIGIYSSIGQLYEPVDKENLLFYKEAKDGQILEEGITEAGGMSSFIAAGTAYATHGINTIPFFIYYSMFGFQRIGDLIWAAGDLRCKGFLLGATAGRTTLAGEGLQHQDGHSHLIASTLPNIISYDPAFAFEIAVIIREGILRMYENQESVFYYLTLQNENYAMPPMPGDVKEGILKGMYLFRASENKKSKLRVTLFGSGSIMGEVLQAQQMLEEDYDISADVWSVTSYTELRREALAVERLNRLNHTKNHHTPYVTECLKDSGDIFVAASDFMKVLPDGISKWIPGKLVSLGTDGFGRSETRKSLREFFEVNANHICYAALKALSDEKRIDAKVVQKAAKDLDIDSKKPNPAIS